MFNGILEVRSCQIHIWMSLKAFLFSKKDVRPKINNSKYEVVLTWKIEVGNFSYESQHHFANLLAGSDVKNSNLSKRLVFEQKIDFLCAIF